MIYNQGEKINNLQKARISATYGINTEVLQKSEEDLLEKAGEGSRGGKVIGHTRSGKPIYGNKSAKNSVYKDFTKRDHADAVKLHKDLYTHHSIQFVEERKKMGYENSTYSAKKDKKLEEDYKKVDKDKLIEGSSFEHNPHKPKTLYHADSAEDHRNMMKKHIKEIGKKLVGEYNEEYSKEEEKISSKL